MSVKIELRFNQTHLNSINIPRIIFFILKDDISTFIYSLLKDVDS